MVSSLVAEENRLEDISVSWFLCIEKTRSLLCPSSEPLGITVIRLYSKYLKMKNILVV